MAKVTRIAQSKGLHKSKHVKLVDMANRLGNLRKAIWQQFGSISGVGITHREIRDKWLKEGKCFNVPARLWKATLSDVVADISMYREAAKVHVRKAIWARTSDEAERKRLYTLLKKDEWMEDSFLRRKMRKHFKHGKTQVNNHIIADSGSYKTFQHGGKTWLSLQSLDKGKRISIPLSTSVAPTGTLRIIVKPDSVDVHYAIDEIPDMRGCGTREIGIDKGYTEVATDTDGVKHGVGLGVKLSVESDYLKLKHQRRNKIKSIANKAIDNGNPDKAKRILENNLGCVKLHNRKAVHTSNMRTIVFAAAHMIAAKASVIVSEDLTSVIKSAKRRSRNQKRRLSGWVKGLIAEAFTSVSRRRGSTLVSIAAAYTSQMDSQTGLLEGKRVGDRFYHASGDVSDADWNAARNILARKDDKEISLYTGYTKVKSILLNRTRLARLGLLNQDTSLGTLPSQ